MPAFATVQTFYDFTSAIVVVYIFDVLSILGATFTDRFYAIPIMSNHPSYLLNLLWCLVTVWPMIARIGTATAARRNDLFQEFGGVGAIRRLEFRRFLRGMICRPLGVLRRVFSWHVHAQSFWHLGPDARHKSHLAINILEK
jgi:hypothetical protein